MKTKTLVEYQIFGPYEETMLMQTKHKDSLEEFVKWMKSEGYVIGKVVKRTIVEEELEDWK